MMSFLGGLPLGTFMAGFFASVVGAAAGVAVSVAAASGVAVDSSLELSSPPPQPARARTSDEQADGE